MKFTPDMFVNKMGQMISGAEAAAIANAKLAELLKDAPTIYYVDAGVGKWTEHLLDTQDVIKSARLICIEKISGDKK